MGRRRGGLVERGSGLCCAMVCYAVLCYGGGYVRALGGPRASPLRSMWEGGLRCGVLCHAVLCWVAWEMGGLCTGFRGAAGISPALDVGGWVKVWRVMSCCVMSCNVMLCYVMLWGEGSR